MRAMWLWACLLVVVAMAVDEGGAINCYVCSDKRDNICKPFELWGNRTQCPSGVTTCYKSWSVEADPKTRRKCGSQMDEPDQGSCEEALEGANKIILCKCGDDLCNGSPRVQGVFGAVLTPITVWLVARTLHRPWLRTP
ncbi:hypothetical protein TCAL_04956 [Tigriopus californicus]|uniref:Uncharacterized protein n=1 Tax=Tigriopus californicus TaxID=6832 RepID=A0A553PDH5_TIGCA|nr:uncharacterized protein LOC131892614 [Tigriopus californicus]TRY75725.1 hypothetical protein TCAL_04956 [Tigriopus californicus]|eukprot:TCALIF_04956-PA protein Name:"Protein of unknown function" AED:0.19 eAED:0.19 QI:353/1/1/1/0.5/0.66/3/398/138